MTVVPDTASFPARAAVKVVMRFVNPATGAEQFFHCSGTLIDAETVLTAAHCLYDVALGYATDVWIYPGWDGRGSVPYSEVTQPFGWATGSQYLVGAGFVISRDYAEDVALLRVTRAVGLLTGWLGTSATDPCGQPDINRTYFNYAYPGEPCGISGLHNGRDMTFWSGTFLGCLPDGQLDLQTSAGCYTALWGGMSGSSAWYESGASRLIRAVASTSDRATIAHYTRLWGGLAPLISDFIANSRGNALDVQALDVRSTPAAQGGTTVNLEFRLANPTNYNPPLRTYSFGVYLSHSSTPQSLTGSGPIDTYETDVDLAAMDSAVITVPGVLIPAGSTVGQQYITISLDAGTDINDTNNVAAYWDAAPINITCPNLITPTDLAATYETNCYAIRVTWTPPPDATGVLPYRSTTPTFSTATAAPGIMNPYGGILDDYSALPGSNYYYWIRASHFGCPEAFEHGPVIGRVSDNVLGSVPGTPYASLSEHCDGVHISWPLSAEYTAYDLYRSAGSNPNAYPGSYLGRFTQPHFIDDTDGGNLWYYYVRGVSPCGVTRFSFNAAGTHGNSGIYLNGGIRRKPPPPYFSVTASDGTRCDGIEVSWTPTYDADFYQVWRSTDGLIETAALLGAPPSGPFLDSAPTPGVQYYYHVRGVNACGAGLFAPVDDGVRAELPQPPSGLAASDNNCAAINLAWQQVPYASAYSVLRNTIDDFGSASVIGTTPDTIFDDIAAPQGTTFFYWVRATGPCGTSGPSASESGIAQGSPPVVASVTAGDLASCDGIDVEWSPVAGATAYQVWRSASSDSGSAVSIGATTDPFFSDTEPAPGEPRYYWVLAVTPCGTGAFAAFDEGSRRGAPESAGSVNASNDGCFGVDITWAAPADSEYFAIYRSDSPNFENASFIDSTYTASYLDSFTQPDTPYHYWIVSGNSCGEGPAGGPATGSWSQPGYITQQPVSTSAPLGGAAVFTVGVQEPVVGYRWFYNDREVPEYDRFSGTSTPVLTINPVAATDATTYWVEVYTACGTEVSQIATLNVLTPPGCDPDVNCDGSVNGFDIEATEQAINGDFSNFCQASADLNGDGAENGFDVETQEQRVNGAPC